MEETKPNRDTPIKDRVLELYFDLCDTSSILMGQMHGNATGSIANTYKAFEKDMFEMYSLCSVLSLRPHVKVKVNQWAKAKRTHPIKNRFIYNSIKVFEEFAKELVSMQIIRI